MKVCFKSSQSFFLQVCSFCRKKGATVGCEIKTCRRSYHYFCALCDDAAIQTNEIQGIYRYSKFCILSAEPTLPISLVFGIIIWMFNEKWWLHCSKRNVSDGEIITESKQSQSISKWKMSWNQSNKILVSYWGWLTSFCQIYMLFASNAKFT